MPPFPGAKIGHFVASPESPTDIPDLTDEICRLRVGGSYWAAQPDVGRGYVLVCSLEALEWAREIAGADRILLWQDRATDHPGKPGAADAILGECDPWHMLSSAKAVVVEPNDELRLIAALLKVPAYIFDPPTGQLARDGGHAAAMLADALSACTFQNPFTGEPMSPREAIELSGFWRRLIDSNRDIAGGLGFAFWKQDHVAPLLWNGAGPFRFLKNATEVPPGATVTVWRAKAPPEAVARLERSGSALIEVEDGFLRSRGLGADCVPPLSITVDRRGAHFDPSQPSELECLLETGHFDQAMLVRARELREMILDAGIGKYEQGTAALDRPAGDRRHVLVPGQVEDDRAVHAGGCGLTSNLELLKRVRAEAPDAYILYKPHPDILAGHRRGAIPDRLCLEYADQIVGEVPIGSLIEIADEVHVNTSLAGFEALLRAKKVTTYGVPFYAGWGLTHDLGPVPARRTARRTIDELVAATLLVYPRYLDPVTGLPCPAEIVVARLCANDSRNPSLLVGVRRLQGRLMRRLRSLVQ